MNHISDTRFDYTDYKDVLEDENERPPQYSSWEPVTPKIMFSNRFNTMPEEATNSYAKEGLDPSKFFVTLYMTYDIFIYYEIYLYIEIYRMFDTYLDNRLRKNFFCCPYKTFCLSNQNLIDTAKCFVGPTKEFCCINTNLQNCFLNT